MINEINNTKLKETLGFEYLNIDIGGPTRNNPMFTEILYWEREEIQAFKIENNKSKDRFRFVYKFKDQNKTLRMGNWNTAKSFGTKLFDFLLLSPSQIQLINSLANEQDGPIIERFLNKWTNTKEAIENLRQSFSKNTLTLFRYWKTLSKSPNHYTRWVVSRIRLIIYKIIRERGMDKSSSNAKYDVLLNKQWKIAHLENIVNSFVLEIIQKNYTTNKESSILDDKQKDIDQYFEKDDKNFSISIKEFVKSVEDGKIGIPIFQRNYVWDIKKIIPLLNSILKNYPIGSILLVDMIPFKTKNKIVETIQIKQSKTQMLVLDGQQRVTSILLCVAYWKIYDEACRTSNAEINNILEKSKIKDICFIFNQENKKYEFISKKKMGKSQKYWDFAISNKQIHKQMLKKIGDYKISVIKTMKLKIDQLIEIFNNINMGSLKLSSIDLLHSLFYGQNDKIDLLKSITNISKSKFIDGYNLPIEQIVKIMKMIYDYQNTNNRHYQKNIIDINIKSIFDMATSLEAINKFMENALKAQKTLELSLKILSENYGFTNYKLLPNIAFLFVVSAICIKHIKKINDLHFNISQYSVPPILIKKIDQKFSEIIKRTINKDYSSATANKVNKDIISIFSNTNRDIQIKQSLSKEIQNTNYGTNSPIYKIIIAQLSLLNPISLIDGTTKVITKNQKYSSTNNEQHHFLPKKCKEFKVLKEEIGNNIRNIFLISYEENRKNISNESPYKYLLKNNKIKNKTNSLLNNIAKTHLLSQKKLKNFYYSSKNCAENQLKKLLEDRSNKIIQLLNNKWSLDNKK